MLGITKATKEAAPGPLTVMDAADDRLKEIIESKAEKNAQARGRILKLIAERDALRKERDEAAAIAGKLTAEYLDALSILHGEETERIREGAVLAEDVKAGMVTVKEFLNHGKRDAEIETAAKIQAEARLAPIRDAIRAQRWRVYDIAVKIRIVEEYLSREYQGVASSFVLELEAILKTLRENGAVSPTIEAAHARKKEADNDFGLARGAVLFHAKQWNCKTLAEVAEIPLDPILQPQHFEAFKKFYAAVRGSDFAEITVCYTPCAIQGREAGEFWHYIRPNVMARR